MDAFRNRTFKWVAENALGWAAFIVANMIMTKEVKNNSPLSSNKFVLKEYLMLFPAGRKAIDIKMGDHKKKMSSSAAATKTKQAQKSSKTAFKVPDAVESTPPPVVASDSSAAVTSAVAAVSSSTADPSKVVASAAVTFTAAVISSSASAPLVASTLKVVATGSTAASASTARSTAYSMLEQTAESQTPVSQQTFAATSAVPSSLSSDMFLEELEGDSLNQMLYDAAADWEKEISSSDAILPGDRRKLCPSRTMHGFLKLFHSC